MQLINVHSLMRKALSGFDWTQEAESFRDLHSPVKTRGFLLGWLDVWGNFYLETCWLSRFQTRTSVPNFLIYGLGWRRLKTTTMSWHFITAMTLFVIFVGDHGPGQFAWGRGLHHNRHFKTGQTSDGWKLQGREKAARFGPDLAQNFRRKETRGRGLGSQAKWPMAALDLSGKQPVVTGYRLFSVWYRHRCLHNALSKLFNKVSNVLDQNL